MSAILLLLVFEREVTSDPFVDPTEPPTLSLSITYLTMNTLVTTLVLIAVSLAREYLLFPSSLVRVSSFAYLLYLQGVFQHHLLNGIALSAACHVIVMLFGTIVSPMTYHHGLMEPTRFSHDTIMSLMRSTKIHHDFRRVILSGTHRVRPLLL